MQPHGYLIDASPYIFRAYYAIPATVRSPRGVQTNAVYGFTEFLIQFLKKTAPTHVAVAFDGSLTSSFRNEIYPDYKAHRDLPPPELEAQIALCIKVTQAMGMTAFVDKKFEADDIIGTFVDKLRHECRQITILSGDKDFAQLVAVNVSLWDFAKNVIYDRDAVFEKFGVYPEQIVDLIALQGDSVDNIPGVNGIGPKSASLLLKQLKSLDQIYANLDQLHNLEIRGAKSLKTKLENNRDSARISQKLAKISFDVPVKVSLAQLKYDGARYDEIDTLFNQLGFGQIKNRIPK